MTDPASCPIMRLLIIITDVEHTKKIIPLLQKIHIPLQYQIRGEGTASSELLDTLGLDSSPKALTAVILPKAVVPRMLRGLELLLLKSVGGGIAFTLPVSGASSPVLHAMSAEINHYLAKHMESEVIKVSQSEEFSLVLAVVNQGFNEEVMDAAKTAGASGGTILRAHKHGLESAAKFLGISVQPEKEVVAILSPKSRKQDIMKAICASCGMKSEAQGLVLSLPVEDVAGIDWTGDDDEV